MEMVTRIGADEESRKIQENLRRADKSRLAGAKPL